MEAAADKYELPGQVRPCIATIIATTAPSLCPTRCADPPTTSTRNAIVSSVIT
jgi:hypothetical protein